MLTILGYSLDSHLSTIAVVIKICSFFSLTFLLLIFSVNGQSSLKKDVLKEMVQRNAKLYIDPSGLISGYYSIDNTGVSIFSSPENNKRNKVECKIYWNEVVLFRQMLKELSGDALLKIYQLKSTKKFPDSLYIFPLQWNKFSTSFTVATKPLKGLRIALDPGHVSGDMEMAAIELKYLKLNQDPLFGLNNSLEIIEGNLTLATAFFLKQQLEEAGAEVMLTRDKPNYSSFGITYPEWLKQANRNSFETAYARGEISLEEKKRFIKNGTPKDIFQNYFRFADLYQRAKIINDYKPDLTVVIHYNVDEKNNPWCKPTKKNYNMVFVPGDLRPFFLDKIENRLELLRLLINDDIAQSVFLGYSLSKSFEKGLKIPNAQPHHATYLKEDCVTTEYNGVYVRNLALTRLIHGPLAYGETLYQDNINECKLLGNRTLEINGIKTSERVKQVAQVYFEGILNYALSLKPQ